MKSPSLCLFSLHLYFLAITSPTLSYTISTTRRKTSQTLCHIFLHYLATKLSYTISTSWLKHLRSYRTWKHRFKLCRLDGFLCVSVSKSCLFCFSLIIKITFEHFTIPPPPPLFLSSSGPMKTLLWESFLWIMILYIIRWKSITICF